MKHKGPQSIDDVEMAINLADQLRWVLPRESLALIKMAGRLAAERRLGIHLVGGVVRDILLGRAISDLDLTVEGSATELAESLAREVGGQKRGEEDKRFQ